MAGLMSDPDIAEGMKNPKVMKAFQDLMSGPGGPMGLMSNPAKLQEMMADPEVRSVCFLWSVHIFGSKRLYVSNHM